MAMLCYENGDQIYDSILNVCRDRQVLYLKGNTHEIAINPLFDMTDPTKLPHNYPFTISMYVWLDPSTVYPDKQTLFLIDTPLDTTRRIEAYYEQYYDPVLYSYSYKFKLHLH